MKDFVAHWKKKDANVSFYFWEYLQKNSKRRVKSHKTTLSSSYTTIQINIEETLKKCIFRWDCHNAFTFKLLNLGHTLFFVLFQTTLTGFYFLTQLDRLSNGLPVIITLLYIYIWGLFGRQGMTGHKMKAISLALGHGHAHFYPPDYKKNQMPIVEFYAS